MPNNSTGASSHQLASDISNMEQTLQKLRLEMQKDREKRRKQMPQGNSGTLWNQAGKIRQQRLRKGSTSSGSGMTTPTSSRTTTRRSRLSSATGRRSRSGSRTSSRTSSAKPRKSSTGTTTTTRTRKRNSSAGGESQTPQLDGLIAVRSTSTGESVSQPQPRKRTINSANVRKPRVQATAAMGRVNPPRATTGMGMSSAPGSGRSLHNTTTQRYKMDHTSADLIDPRLSSRQQAHIQQYHNMPPQASSSVHASPQDPEDYSAAEQGPDLSEIFTEEAMEQFGNYHPTNNQQRVIHLDQMRSDGSRGSARNSVTPSEKALDTTLYSGAFNTAQGAAEDSYALDYTHDEFQKLEELPGPTQETSPSQQQQGSLLDGTYDERANAQEFQDAVQAWRQANGVPTNGGKVSSGTQSSQGTGTSTSTTATTSNQSLIEGTYDEQANRKAFQDAVMEWRRGVANSNQTDANQESPISPGTTLHQRNGNEGSEVSVRGMRNRTGASKTSSGTTASSGTNPNEANSSLLEGTYDEEANRKAFQAAVMSWRRKNIPGYQQESGQNRPPTTDSGIGTDLNGSSRNRNHPKEISERFGNNLVSCLYPSYFDKLDSEAVKSVYLF